MAQMIDGECLCKTCAKANAKQIIRDTRNNDRWSDWNCEGIFVNWEDADLYCAHCNGVIEAAYTEEPRS